jgi:multidrug efflux system outer membrane protein
MLLLNACSVPSELQKESIQAVPGSFNGSEDTLNSAYMRWQEFFRDTNLIALIDTALKNNQELNIALQEIHISGNEVMARKGEYQPFVGLGAGAGMEKVGRYTRNGSVEVNNDIRPGEEFPEPLPDYMFGASASWEVDIWNKLHNAKKAAAYRYLKSVDGRNFMVTNLVSEIASSYYELLALDRQLEIVKQNIQIQKDALAVVKLQKNAAKVTELAVRKFEAEVLKNRSRQYDIQQQIIETENRINYLVGRFPQPVKRNPVVFEQSMPDTIYSGLPSQLLENRPDVRRAEMELAASRLDVKSAKAEFYPSLTLTAGIGYQAFNPSYLVSTPESMMYGLAGELLSPLINRKAIKARYYTANSKQVQAMWEYEQTIVNAYTEVINQLAMIENLRKNYNLKEKQVEALTESVLISSRLFRSARADYMEVLMTQRDALDAKIELIETKKRQLIAMVDMYRALGGGWN